MKTSLRSIDELTCDWLSAALGTPVAEFTSQQIGTGQMSDSYRIALTYAEPTAERPRTVVLKLAAADDTSRATGASLGLYKREVRFYADLAPHIGGPLAPAHLASFDERDNTFSLLVGDAAPARQGDEIIGATRPDADAAIDALAALHRPVLGSQRLATTDWLNRESPISQDLMKALLSAFMDRYRQRIADHHQVVCERLVASFDGWLGLADAAPRGLVHGDYRLDNLLFGEADSPRPVTVVDWQTVTHGDAFIDLAYFLGCALTIENRRAWADELIVAYHAGLGPAAPSLDGVRAGVRRQSFFGVMMAIISTMMVERTERGDEMFMTVLERHAQQVLDLAALELLPPPTASEPLAPVDSDEGIHVPGPEALFNESWYFDFVDDARQIGGYVRLGTYPNLDRAWYTALICGPSRPTIAVIDLHAPLPDHTLAVQTELFRATQNQIEPLRSSRATLTGTGEAYDDPAAILRGERGRTVAVELDLTWETNASPYQYRLTPRYEIPCRVHGTISVDGENLAIDAPGQRDHSWGVRDWWSMDWVWFAAHLDDGRRLHGLDLRIPGAPTIGIGYLQGPGTPIQELERVSATETIGPDGLVTHTHLLLEPGGLEIDVVPIGHGPLLLTADDGRVAQFPRSWCRFRTVDGCGGVGWVEWNRNVAALSRAG